MLFPATFFRFIRISSIKANSTLLHILNRSNGETTLAISTSEAANGIRGKPGRVKLIGGKSDKAKLSTFLFSGGQTAQ